MLCLDRDTHVDTAQRVSVEDGVERNGICDQHDGVCGSKGRRRQGVGKNGERRWKHANMGAVGQPGGRTEAQQAEDVIDHHLKAVSNGPRGCVLSASNGWSGARSTNEIESPQPPHERRTFSSVTARRPMLMKLTVLR